MLSLIADFVVHAASRFSSKGPWGNDNNPKGQAGSSIFGDMNFNKIPAKYVGRLWMMAVAAIIALWFATGLYVINPDQEGVELRCGKYFTTKGPGLHYHLPHPVEDVIKVSVTSVQRMEIGYRTLGDRNERSADRANLEQESLMLTKDENIVDTNFEIQWKIKDVRNYLFNFRGNEVNPTVKNAAEAMVREVIGRQGIAALLDGTGRTMLADELQTSLQKLFDNYGMGVHIVSIQIKKVDPPAAVIDAFRDVQSARADKERAVNIAYAYSNDIIPRARGEAAAMINDAEAYRESVLHNAHGESQRFSMTYAKYKESKEIVKEKIYIETMQEIFSDMNKIIVDKQGSSMYYMPLSELLQHKEKS